MKVLITGGFGNIGLLVVDEILKRGHEATVFDLPSKRNIRLSRKYAAKGVKVFLGNILNDYDIKSAAIDKDVVIHLAAILPPKSEKNPELCDAVNVGGTEKLIKALQLEKTKPVLIEVSSASVMGHTQDRDPPVLPYDSLRSYDIYSRTKIKAESLVEESGLPFCILRLSAVIPTAINISSLLSMVEILFDMPLDARCEIVFDIDVADALVSTAENMTSTKEMLGEKFFIAGGRQNGCQTVVRDFIKSIFEPLRLPVPNESLFPKDYNSYYLDWYDTKDGQDLLDYQHHSIKDWHTMIKKKYGFFLPIIPLIRTIILKWLEKKSPRFSENMQGGKYG